MVENGDWKWPDIWRSKLPFLFHLPPPLIIHGKNDMVLWKYNDGKVGNFLVKAVWSDLSVSKPSVPWYKLVWLSQNILRHAFILWLAINQKLKTLNRIAIWQGIPDVKCLLISGWWPGSRGKGSNGMVHLDTKVLLDTGDSSPPSISISSNGWD
ncbi:RNA-directed DNA polymerase, eukaryota, reverse transcriptase zinc-binding domain protein [Tanacetum coccineum]